MHHHHVYRWILLGALILMGAVLFTFRSLRRARV